ncbi:unnamed protein product [Gongylonema pulchrum]|uniref:Sulfate_transp domain-containing protein n=1 Tax=Gongylonema pulchrum TaxID=637853 RepID=A0A183E0J6_9BILA|nr:unnamed protein product [Gongylonema pulchrum]
MAVQGETSSTAFLEQIRKTVGKAGTENLLNCIKRFMPLVSWLPNYSWRHSFFGDLSGGLTMAVLAVPQAIAHSALTGVEAVHGLYSAIFPAFFYIFFGTSRHNALGIA